MKLNEKAESATTVVRADSAAGCYRLETDELTDAEDIGEPDAFPQFGHFADVVEIGMDGTEHDEAWLETPAGLARSLVDHGVEPGDRFVVHRPEKNDDGDWRFDLVSGDDVADLLDDD